MTVKENKNTIRKKVKILLDNFSFDENIIIAENIFTKIENLEIFANSKNILHYWSIYNEVPTHNCINRWALTKKILLPVVHGDILLIKEFSGEENMIIGNSFGIKEPLGKIFEDFSSIDLAIIPGLAFDKNNNRMGRGKGFYDKLLKKLNIYKIGVCYDFQLFESIPVTSNDIKMDMIVCG